MNEVGLAITVAIAVFAVLYMNVLGRMATAIERLADDLESEGSTHKQDCIGFHAPDEDEA